jgi:hypothetical protein
MGFISIGGKPDPSPKGTHMLYLDATVLSRLRSDPRCHDGYVRYAERALAEWAYTNPSLGNTDLETHKALATAWGLPAHTVKIPESSGTADFCPAAYATFGSLLPAPSAATLIENVGNKEFTKEVTQFMPGRFFSELTSCISS